MYPLTYYKQIPFEEADKTAQGVVIVIIVLGLIATAVYLTYDHYQTKQWKKGIFPIKLKYTNENLLKAYISLSASMIRRDITENSVKSEYAITKLKKEFPGSKENIKYALNFSLRYPIQINTVCDWLNEHLKDDFSRLQIIYFLAGLSMSNGKFLQIEYKLLQYLTHVLNLDPKDLETIVANFYQQRKKQKTTNKKSRAKAKTRPPAKSKITSYYKLLGVNEASTLKEIKKAYRKLAMIYHPDKFETQGEEKMRKAQEHFLKIQEAYKYLEENVKS